MSADCFLPKPDVESSVIQIIPQRQFDIERERYTKTVRGMFAMRRKTLANNLKSSFGITGDAAAGIFSAADIDPKRRAETLSAQEFANLAQAIYDR